MLHTGQKGNNLSNPHHKSAQHALPEKKTICKEHNALSILSFNDLRNMPGSRTQSSHTMDGRATQLQINGGKHAHYIKAALVGFKLAVSSVLGPTALNGNHIWPLYLNLNLSGLKNITHPFPTWCFFSHMYHKVTDSTHSTEQSLDPKAEWILLIKKW